MDLVAKSSSKDILPLLCPLHTRSTQLHTCGPTELSVHLNIPAFSHFYACLGYRP